MMYTMYGSFYKASAKVRKATKHAIVVNGAALRF